MQRMSDDALTDCPECDGLVHRVIQPVGIIFKGSGFYVTDNRSGSSSTLSPPKESDKSGAKEESGEGESKPETSTSSSPKDDD
jgi:predicted nucleic acid-binding Zn ribbon protein